VIEMLDPFTLSFGALGLAGTALGWSGSLRARRADAQLRKLRDELRVQCHAASHDPLTDLPNRRAFFHRSASLLADSARRPAVVVLLDLDNFKYVNDRYGHAAGDHVLVTIARRLAGYADDNPVARLGGDEFAALIMPRAGAPAHPDVPSLAALVAAPIRFGGHSLSVTASIGFADLTDGTSLVRALHQADLAMYQAKRTGGDSCQAAVTPRLEEGGQAGCQLPASIPVVEPPRTSPPPTAICRPTRSGSTVAARGDRVSSKPLPAAPRR